MSSKATNSQNKKIAMEWLRASDLVKSSSYIVQYIEIYFTLFHIFIYGNTKNIYIYIYIFAVYTCIQTYTHIYISIYIYIYIYISIYIHMHVCICRELHIRNMHSIPELSVVRVVVEVAIFQHLNGEGGAPQWKMVVARRSWSQRLRTPGFGRTNLVDKHAELDCGS